MKGPTQKNRQRKPQLRQTLLSVTEKNLGRLWKAWKTSVHLPTLEARERPSQRQRTCVLSKCTYEPSPEEALQHVSTQLRRFKSHRGCPSDTAQLNEEPGPRRWGQRTYANSSGEKRQNSNNSSQRSLRRETRKYFEQINNENATYPYLWDRTNAPFRKKCVALDASFH